MTCKQNFYLAPDKENKCSQKSSPDGGCGSVDKHMNTKSHLTLTFPSPGDG